MSYPKVIMLYNQLMHYRVPVWNILAQKCELTVAYSIGNGEIPEGLDCKFKIIYLPTWRFAGRIVIQKTNIRKLVSNYDVVIAYGDIAWLKYSTLPWFGRHKVVFHTLGVSASYNKKYDTNQKWDRIRKFFYSKASAIAFYTSYPIEKYAKMGIPREKMFEAPNTVEVHPISEKMEKDSILFIGTLYRAKGLQTLLDSYLTLRNLKELPILRIVGKGPESDSIRQWIFEKNMDNKIEMLGPIYDIEEKAKLFAKAIACISPRQAGLSVLESMGYGVPFISSKNAITGGELFNIHNGIDGVVMDNENELTNIIQDISLNKDKYVKMGQAAQVFYNEHRTPWHMAQGLWQAVQYAIKS